MLFLDLSIYSSIKHGVWVKIKMRSSQLLLTDIGVAAFFLLVLVLSMMILVLSWKCFVVVLWTPFQVTRFFRKQGVNGPSNRLVLGSLGEIRSMKMASKAILMDVNSHDASQRILPHLLKWFSQYGIALNYT